MIPKTCRYYFTFALIALSGCATTPPEKPPIVYAPRPVELPVPATPAPATNSPVVISTIWDALVNGRRIAYDTQHPRIQQQLQRYLTEPRYLEQVMERAEPFLFHILQELDKADLPSELALLPVIESAYLTQARSRSGASGLWQIMPETARELGLKRTGWYDGRRDPLASTQAAVTYLSILNQRLEGDWLLTLAAYNAGFTTVSQAINHNRRKNMPDETMNYVPRFLAVINLIENPEHYGMSLPDIPYSPRLTQLAVNKPVDLKLLAQHAEVENDLLLRINAAYNHGIVSPKESAALLAPLEAADSLNQALKSLPPAKLASLRQHTVNKGETLSHISRLYSVHVDAIKQFNHLTSSRIRVGQRLIIPVPAGTETPPQQTAGVHVVRKGETLWQIARHYRMTVAQLARLNDLQENEVIKPGRTLLIRDS
jgi:membrane-bound lytic murein transglycosylase D